MTELILSRPKEFKARMRTYKILIDGEEVHRLAMDSSHLLELSPGKHTLEAKVDWAGSGIIPFEVQKGEKLDVEIYANQESFYFFLIAALSILAFIVVEVVFSQSLFFLLLFALPFFVLEAYLLTLGRNKYLKIRFNI